MWVIGGSQYAAIKTTELADISDSTISAELPYKMYHHCATLLNSTHGIITGGFYGYSGYYYRETLIVDLNDLTMTTGPALQKTRYMHACTRISAVNGTDYAIVAGGRYTSDTSEIMDGNSWKYGKH